MTQTEPRKTNILFRSLALQLFLNYKTMQGPGYLYALKSELSEHDKKKVKASASFINGHPVFSSLALGALAKQLREPVDAERTNAIADWKRGLSTPLGSIGDSLIWERFKPALLTLVVTLVLMSSANTERVWIWAVIGLLMVFNLTLWWFRNWGFARGFELGERVSELAVLPALSKVRRAFRLLGMCCAGLLLASAIGSVSEGGFIIWLQFALGFLLMLGASFVRASTLTVAFFTILSSFGIYFLFSQPHFLP